MVGAGVAVGLVAEGLVPQLPDGADELLPEPAERLVEGAALHAAHDATELLVGLLEVGGGLLDRRGVLGVVEALGLLVVGLLADERAGLLPERVDVVAQELEIPGEDLDDAHGQRPREHRGRQELVHDALGVGVGLARGQDLPELVGAPVVELLAPDALGGLRLEHGLGPLVDGLLEHAALVVRLALARALAAAVVVLGVAGVPGERRALGEAPDVADGRDEPGRGDGPDAGDLGEDLVPEERRRDLLRHVALEAALELAALEEHLDALELHLEPARDRGLRLVGLEQRLDELLHALLVGERRARALELLTDAREEVVDLALLGLAQDEPGDVEEGLVEERGLVELCLHLLALGQLDEDLVAVGREQALVGAQQALLGPAVRLELLADLEDGRVANVGPVELAQVAPREHLDRERAVLARREDGRGLLAHRLLLGAEVDPGLGQEARDALVLEAVVGDAVDDRPERHEREREAVGDAAELEEDLVAGLHLGDEEDLLALGAGELHGVVLEADDLADGRVALEPADDVGHALGGVREREADQGLGVVERRNLLADCQSASLCPVWLSLGRRGTALCIISYYIRQPFHLGLLGLTKPPFCLQDIFFYCTLFRQRRSS